ncbi:protein ANTAGONIST OF LIKE HETEROCHROMATIN PROTEIN 1 [Curcuma longa]|uniref:protein ANTAGONIST OF LIKE HETEROCHROMATIN PROTEIN 1 n=1 Tax=Curcuma longa TaxID=136217 RepID=UPI003D9DBD91
MDDLSSLLMLSNLLHLQTYLDPTSSPPSPSSFPSTSSAAAPLLFFAIASVLSYASSSSLRDRRPRRRRRCHSSPSLSPPPRPSRSLASASSAFFLSPDRALSMDPSSRDTRFRSLYGISYPIFETLLKNLRHLDAAAFPSSLPLDRGLSIALSRLSRGLSSRSLAGSLGVPPSIVSRCTHALTRLLSTRLYPHYVTLPTTPDHLLSTIQSFKDLTGLPNLAAAIASSPVRLRPSSPSDSAAGYGADLLRSTSRSFPSILLQAVSDHRKIFLDACVRAPGSSDPASHLRESSLYHHLLDEDNPLPFRDNIITVHGQRVRPYLIGDSSYPLLPFLLTPFSTPASSVSSAGTSGAYAREMFDSAVAKGRAASVEAAIALLKGRWKILRNLNVGLDHAAQTVVACVVLHNMCQFAKEPEDEGRYMWRDPPESSQPASLVDSERSLYYLGKNLRQTLADDLYERQHKHSSGAR